jgi:hypothetical protein
MANARWILLVVVSLGALLPLRTSAESANAPAETSLAPLPKPPPVGLPEPEREELERADALVARMTSAAGTARDQVLHEVSVGGPKLVPAVAQRLAAIADKAEREEMKRLLGEARRRARDEVREDLRSEGRREKVVTPDYLGVLVAHAHPDSKAWRDLVAVVALSRILVEVGTVEAARQLVEVYVRFGEFLRVDTQLQLEKMGDRALAALIETRRHKADKIAKWAERQLDALGKAVPGEAIQTGDPEVLADVLRAYGRIRDPDAARIVVTFCNSERAQVREAARQAVAMMGEVAQWQLRDTYENFAGQRPPRDWSWERTARELFERFDRQRLAQVYNLFEQGKRSHREKKLDDMQSAFDRVLAQNPLFDRRGEMAAGYLEYAREAPPARRDQALAAVRRAERIAPNEGVRKAASSLRLTLEAETWLERGTADQSLLRRGLELDPANQRAKRLLASPDWGQPSAQVGRYRYLGAGAIAVVALVGMVSIWFGFRRKQPLAQGAAPAAETAPPETVPATESRTDAAEFEPAAESETEPASASANAEALAPEPPRDPIGELLGETDDRKPS